MPFLFSLGKGHSSPTYFSIYIEFSKKEKNVEFTHPKEKDLHIAALAQTGLTPTMLMPVLLYLHCIQPFPAWVLFSCPDNHPDNFSAQTCCPSTQELAHYSSPRYGLCCSVLAAAYPWWTETSMELPGSAFTFFIYMSIIWEIGATWMYGHFLDTLCWVYFSNDFSWDTQRFLSFAGTC